jgi:hypothetical protein
VGQARHVDGVTIRPVRVSAVAAFLDGEPEAVGVALLVGERPRGETVCAVAPAHIGRVGRLGDLVPEVAVSGDRRRPEDATADQAHAGGHDVFGGDAGDERLREAGERDRGHGGGEPREPGLPTCMLYA